MLPTGSERAGCSGGERCGGQRRGRLHLAGGTRPGSSWSLLLNAPRVPKSLLRASSQWLPAQAVLTAAVLGGSRRPICGPSSTGVKPGVWTPHPRMAPELHRLPPTVTYRLFRAGLFRPAQQSALADQVVSISTTSGSRFPVSLMGARPLPHRNRRPDAQPASMSRNRRSRREMSGDRPGRREPLGSEP